MKYNEKIEQIKEWEDTKVESNSEFKYPMWFRSKTTGDIVEFSNLSEGKCVFINEKYDYWQIPTLYEESDDWIEHTRKDIWEQVENPEYIDKMDKIVDEAVKEVVSDGSKNKFYEIPDWIKDLDDLSEYLNLDPYEFNILKTLWIHKGKRHSGTNELRELNKRLHYAEKSKEKYLRSEKDKE